MVAGLHVPVIAGVFVELVGSAVAVEFRHSGPICVNDVVIEGVTTIFIVAIVAH
jgi:hypothetical protein